MKYNFSFAANFNTEGIPLVWEDAGKYHFKIFGKEFTEVDLLGSLNLRELIALKGLCSYDVKRLLREREDEKVTLYLAKGLTFHLFYDGFYFTGMFANESNRLLNFKTFLKLVTPEVAAVFTKLIDKYIRKKEEEILKK